MLILYSPERYIKASIFNKRPAKFFFRQIFFFGNKTLCLSGFSSYPYDSIQPPLFNTPYGHTIIPQKQNTQYMLIASGYLHKMFTLQPSPIIHHLLIENSSSSHLLSIYNLSSLLHSNIIQAIAIIISNLINNQAQQITIK